MLQLQSNGRHKRYAYIKTLIHVFNEIVELNGLNFSIFFNNFIRDNKNFCEIQKKHSLNQITGTNLS